MMMASGGHRTNTLLGGIIMKHAVSVRHLDAALAAIVTELAPEIELSLSDTGTPILATKGEGLSVRLADGALHVTYDALCSFSRAVSLLPSVLSGKGDVMEQKRYDLLCYMADVSHAAAMNMTAVKRFIRLLALMGYDSFMLYTEDTFELPGYKYFGYMRGRYSTAELREIDDYAFALGLEVIPCVQTLAHLNTAVRWPDFAGFVDCENILLVGDERTYAYVDAVLKQCRACFRSNRINIGMDEAHMLGRGKYLDEHGHRNTFDIMLDHLKRVTEQCTSYGYHPMIWSDMFFRIAFNDNYYVSEGEIPADVIAKVPPEVDLVYWDYYNPHRSVIDHMFHCHNQFTQNKTVFAGGVWRWGSPAAFNKFSMLVTKEQLDSCEAHGCREVIVTTWADNNCASSVFSTNASTLYFAERCYAGDVDEAHMDKRCYDCFGMGFEDAIAFDLPNDLPGTSVKLRLTAHGYNPSKYLLYNDPLQGLLDLHFDPETAAPTYAAHAARLLALGERGTRFGYAYRVLGLLCRVLELKCDFSYRLRRAYKAGDRAELARMASEDVPAIISRLEEYMVAYRDQWYRENKPFNLNVQEIRIGGLTERMRSVKYAVEAYLNGKLEHIEELEQEQLPFSGRDFSKDPTPYYYFDGYARLTSVSGI